MVNVNKLLTKRKVNFNSRIVEHNTSAGQFNCQYSKVKYLPLVTEELTAMNPVNKMSLLESPGVGMHRNVDSWQLLQGNGNDPGLMACMESLSDRSGNNITELQKIMESNVSPGANSAVSAILEQVQQLSDEQKLFLYLKLPTTATPLPGISTPSSTNGGLLLSPGNITQQQPPNFGVMAENVKNRSEDQFTITWIRTHLELDPKVSLLKEEIYNEYEHYCTSKGVKSQGRADFGKLMKQVFPNLKPRRLGQRGASRYCYSGLRKTNGLRDPEGTEIFSMKNKDSDSWWNGSNTPTPCNDSIRGNVNYCALSVVLEWAEKTLSLSPAQPKESGVNIKIERKNSGEYVSQSEDASSGEFTSLVELASALVRDKRVDSRSYHAAIISKITSEGNCEGLRFSPDDNSRYSLQKNMQEKDQKRKLHDVIPGVQLAQPTTRTVQKVRRKSSCSSGTSSRNPSGDSAVSNASGDSAVSNTSGDSAVSNTSGDSVVSNSSGVSSLSSTSSIRMSTERVGQVIAPYIESSCNQSSSAYNGFRALVDVKPNIESICSEQPPESSVSAGSSIAGSVITTISNGAKVNNQMLRPQVLNLNQQSKVTEEKKNIISLKNEMITKFVANSADNYVNNCTNFTPARLTKDNLQKLNLGGVKQMVKAPGVSDMDANSSHSFRNNIRQIDSSGAPNVTVSDGMFFVPQITDISSQASVSRQQKPSHLSAVRQKEDRLEEEAEKQDQLSILRQVLPYYLPSNQIKQTKGATPDNRYLNNGTNARDKNLEFTPAQQGNGIQLNSYRNINSHCNTADTSANASPFTSPQMTPQHPRSRHNSGQATTYVTPRSTPYTPQEDVFNPGTSYSCSSVLASNTTPFVSPATTPQCSRSRHNSSQGHRLHPNGGLPSTSSIGPVCGARSRHSSGAARHPYAPPKDHNLLQQRRMRNSSGGGILAHSAPHSPLIDDMTHGGSILQQHLTGNVSHSDMRRRHLSAGHSMHHHNQQMNQYSGSVVVSNKPVEQFAPVQDFAVNQQLFSVSEAGGLVEGPDNRPQSVPLPDMLRNPNFSQSVPSTPLLHHNQQPLMHQISHDSALTQFQGLDNSNIGEKSHFNFEQSMPSSFTPTPVPSELSDFNTDNCLANLSNFNNFDALQNMSASTSDGLQNMSVSASDVLQTMAESTSPITFSVEDFVSTVRSCHQNTTTDSFMVGGDGFSFFNSSDNDSGSFINGNNNQLFSRNNHQSVNTSLPQNIFSPSDINQSNTFHPSSGTDITLNELNTTNLSDSSIGTSGLNLVDDSADEVFNHQDINLVL